jgi:NhaA family Na+:H+ antiporter
MLIGELALGADSLRTKHVEVGVLTGTLLAALLAAVLLRLRDGRHRRIAETDPRDADGIPDVFQRPDDHAPAETVEERSERRRQPHGDLPVA